MLRWKSTDEPFSVLRQRTSGDAGPSFRLLQAASDASIDQHREEGGVRMVTIADDQWDSSRVVEIPSRQGNRSILMG